MQTACARAGEVLVGAPLDDGDVDAHQRELARQHHPRRTSSSDHHRMLCHGRCLCGMTRGLPQAPVSGISCKWRGTGVARLLVPCVPPANAGAPNTAITRPAWRPTFWPTTAQPCAGPASVKKPGTSLDVTSETRCRAVAAGI